MFICNAFAGDINFYFTSAANSHLIHNQTNPNKEGSTTKGRL